MTLVKFYIWKILFTKRLSHRATRAIQSEVSSYLFKHLNESPFEKPLDCLVLVDINLLKKFRLIISNLSMLLRN